MTDPDDDTFDERNADLAAALTWYAAVERYTRGRKRMWFQIDGREIHYGLITIEEVTDG